jgi:hypothetical protein
VVGAFRAPPPDGPRFLASREPGKGSQDSRWRLGNIRPKLVRLALQDQVRDAGLKLEVDVYAA